MPVPVSTQEKRGKHIIITIASIVGIAAFIGGVYFGRTTMKNNSTQEFRSKAPIVETIPNSDSKDNGNLLGSEEKATKDIYAPDRAKALKEMEGLADRTSISLSDDLRLTDAKREEMVDTYLFVLSDQGLKVAFEVIYAKTKTIWGLADMLELFKVGGKIREAYLESVKTNEMYTRANSKKARAQLYAQYLEGLFKDKKIDAQYPSAGEFGTLTLSSEDILTHSPFMVDKTESVTAGNIENLVNICRNTYSSPKVDKYNSLFKGSGTAYSNVVLEAFKSYSLSATNPHKPTTVNEAQKVLDNMLKTTAEYVKNNPDLKSKDLKAKFDLLIKNNTNMRESFTIPAA